MALSRALTPHTHRYTERYHPPISARFIFFQDQWIIRWETIKNIFKKSILHLPPPPDPKRISSIDNGNEKSHIEKTQKKSWLYFHQSSGSLPTPSWYWAIYRKDNLCLNLNQYIVLCTRWHFPQRHIFCDTAGACVCGCVCACVCARVCACTVHGIIEMNALIGWGQRVSVSHYLLISQRLQKEKVQSWK